MPPDEVSAFLGGRARAGVTGAPEADRDGWRPDLLMPAR
jgi:hypothetical protein